MFFSYVETRFNFKLECMHIFMGLYCVHTEAMTPEEEPSE